MLKLNKCHRWFAKFKKGDQSFDAKPWTGVPNELDLDLLKEEIQTNPSQSTRTLAVKLNSNHETTRTALYALDKVQKQGYYIQHEQTPMNLWQKLSLATSLLSRLEHHRFQTELLLAMISRLTSLTKNRDCNRLTLTRSQRQLPNLVMVKVVFCYVFCWTALVYFTICCWNVAKR